MTSKKTSVSAPGSIPNEICHELPAHMGATIQHIETTRTDINYVFDPYQKDAILLVQQELIGLDPLSSRSALVLKPGTRLTVINSEPQKLFVKIIGGESNDFWIYREDLPSVIIETGKKST